MKTLFISPRQCWPVLSGAKLREYHFLRALAKRGEVTYLHFLDPGSAPLTAAELPFCHEIVSVPKPRAYGPANILAGVFSEWPLHVLNYTSEAMAQAVQRLTSRSKFDVVHLDSIHMIRYTRPSDRVVYDWHNIESEAMDRYAATVTGLPRRWYSLLTARKLRRLEDRILRNALGHVVCSERERAQLCEPCPGAPVEVVENGVDAGYFSGLRNGRPEGCNLIFVGAMAYSANVDAAVFFAQNIWPRIFETVPSARLAIVGSNPLPPVRELDKIPGVTVTGTVPDVRPWYRDALAALVPLRTGGGTRLKILESMAAGVPVISTPLGAEGLPVTPERDILFADANDSASWIRCIVRLAENREFGDALTSRAAELVRKRYDWETVAGRLGDIYAGWLAGNR